MYHILFAHGLEKDLKGIPKADQKRLMKQQTFLTESIQRKLEKDSTLFYGKKRKRNWIWSIGHID
jgi:hypothetical protein